MKKALFYLQIDRLQKNYLSTNTQKIHYVFRIEISIPKKSIALR